MLRRLGILAVALSAFVLLGPGAGSGAETQPPPDAYLGEWTPDASSNPTLAGHAFYVQSVDESVARGTAADWAYNFDNYCKSTDPGIGDVSYFVVTYTWNSGNSLGGCESALTGGHLYAWTTEEVIYFHAGTVKGEPVAPGGWEYTNSQGHGVTEDFTAHHPAAQFLAHVQWKQVSKKKTGKYVGYLATFAAAGDVPVVSKPASDCGDVHLAGGFGSATLKLVKIGGPSLVELDSVTVKLDGDPAGGDYQSCKAQGDILRGLNFTVTKSDPHEKDACPVGTEGDFALVDNSGSDEVVFHLPGCKISLTLLQRLTTKGSHVAVAIDLNEKGY